IVACLLLAAGMAWTAHAGSEASGEGIDQLIAKLGSSKYAEREAAMRALDQHGAAALPDLEAATRHADPEVRHRATLLLRRIEHRLALARLLAGKTIRLV